MSWKLFDQIVPASCSRNELSKQTNKQGVENDIRSLEGFMTRVNNRVNQRLFGTPPQVVESILTEV